MRRETAGGRHGVTGQRSRLVVESKPGRASRNRPALALAAAPGSPPARSGHRKRRGSTSAVWLAVVPVGVLLVGLTVYAFQNARQAPAPRPAAVARPPVPASGRNLVVASLPFWNIGPGTSAVLTHRWAVDEVSPWMYGLGSSGQIVLDAGINARAFTGYLDRLRAKGLPVVPTLANVGPGGNWSYPLAARMLHHRALMARQVSAIVALVRRGGYAGIDLDYEELHAGDRNAFTRFVTHLGAALHAAGKVLSVAVFAKADNAGYAPRNVAQDYAAIGRAADQVRLMGYDYHWTTSPPGPIAPVSWIRAVLRYATTQIPARKIVLGIPCYGYDWTGHHGKPVTWMRAVRLASDHHATIHYDTSSQAPWFSYTGASGEQHTVWFEDAASSAAKFSLAKAAGLGGVYLWMYGNGEPGTWPALRQVLPTGTTAAVKGAS